MYVNKPSLRNIEAADRINAINNVSACSVPVFEHDKVVSSTQKNFRARDAVECCNVFLSAGNNRGVLKNSTEHAETLFIAFRQFP